MVGVRELWPQCEIVHFIDDDVVLENGYFEGLERCLAANPSVLGVGGVMPSAARPSADWRHRMLLLDSARGGRVLRSGVNVLPRVVTAPTDVDWLSGCSMSYRTSVLRTLSFDLRMSGYCLGEDVGFSYRVGRMGRLMVTPEARLEHLQSPADRLAALDLARQVIAWRHAFVAEMSHEGLSMAAYWWPVVGDLLLAGANGLLRRRRSRLDYASAILKGVSDIVIGSARMA